MKRLESLNQQVSSIVVLSEQFHYLFLGNLIVTGHRSGKIHVIDILNNKKILITTTVEPVIQIELIDLFGRSMNFKLQYISLKINYHLFRLLSMP